MLENTVTSTLGSALLGPFPPLPFPLPHGIPQLFSGGEHACRSRTSGMLACFFRASRTLENDESIHFSQPTVLSWSECSETDIQHVLFCSVLYALDTSATVLWCTQSLNAQAQVVPPILESSLFIPPLHGASLVSFFLCPYHVIIPSKGISGLNGRVSSRESDMPGLVA